MVDADQGFENLFRKVGMTITQLDHFFPYLCFAYGVLMCVALNIPAVVRLADEKLPAEIASQWRARRGLAFVCLFVGAVWILQNLWLA